MGNNPEYRRRKSKRQRAKTAAKIFEAKSEYRRNAWPLLNVERGDCRYPVIEHRRPTENPLRAQTKAMSLGDPILVRNMDNTGYRIARFVCFERCKVFVAFNSGAITDFSPEKVLAIYPAELRRSV